MKIRNIYLKNGIPFVSLTFFILCIAVTLTAALVPATTESLMFSYPIRNPWQFITYVFHHYTPQYQLPPELPYSSAKLTIGHFVYNMMLIIPFGILVENVIKTKKFLILLFSAWLLDVSAIFIMMAVLTPKGESSTSKGASGLAFALMPVGVYILFVMGKKYGFGKLFKQISFYLLMPIAILTLIIALSPNIKGVAGIPSMILHLVAVIVGVIFAIVFRKTINSFFEKESEIPNQNK